MPYQARRKELVTTEISKCPFQPLSKKDIPGRFANNFTRYMPVKAIAPTNNIAWAMVNRFLTHFWIYFVLNFYFKILLV